MVSGSSTSHPPVVLFWSPVLRYARLLVLVSDSSGPVDDLSRSHFLVMLAEDLESETHDDELLFSRPCLFRCLLSNSPPAFSLDGGADILFTP